MMGLPSDMLFKIRHGAEVSNVDEDILFLITNICEGLQMVKKTRHHFKHMLCAAFCPSKL